MWLKITFLLSKEDLNLLSLDIDCQNSLYWTFGCQFDSPRPWSFIFQQLTPEVVAFSIPVDETLPEESSSHDAPIADLLPSSSQLQSSATTTMSPPPQFKPVQLDDDGRTWRGFLSISDDSNQALSFIKDFKLSSSTVADERAFLNRMIQRFFHSTSSVNTLVRSKKSTSPKRWLSILVFRKIQNDLDERWCDFIANKERCYQFT